MIYQQSICQAHLPQACKQAKVIALYKGKGIKSDPSSYRPTSLTAKACKVLERIVVEQMRDYFPDNFSLCKALDGYVPVRSTVTNLQFDEAIVQYLNNFASCDVILHNFN